MVEVFKIRKPLKKLKVWYGRGNPFVFWLKIIMVIFRGLSHVSGHEL